MDRGGVSMQIVLKLNFIRCEKNYEYVSQSVQISIHSVKRSKIININFQTGHKRNARERTRVHTVNKVGSTLGWLNINQLHKYQAPVFHFIDSYRCFSRIINVDSGFPHPQASPASPSDSLETRVQTAHSQCRHRLH